jgi:hypothetical protein
MPRRRACAELAPRLPPWLAGSKRAGMPLRHADAQGNRALIFAFVVPKSNRSIA